MDDSVVESVAEFQWMADHALLIRLQPSRMDVSIDTVMELTQRLEQAFWDVHAVTEWTIGYDTISLHYDALSLTPQTLLHRVECVLEAYVTQSTNKHQAPRTEAGPASTSVFTLPVLYGGEAGPDLEHVAFHAGLSPEKVIETHEAGRYRVALLGFAPGFPYFEGLDVRLATPRKAVPRGRVPAGSVAIAGRHTGIYSFETPGGWHVIGRTPIRLFDPTLTDPARLHPGMHVRFQSISKEAYDDLLRA